MLDVPPKFQSSQLPAVHQQLFFWWRQAGRVLPWREKALPAQPANEKNDSETSSAAVLREQAFTTYMAQELRRDPYRVVVAELMLQQTQVDRVLPKYLSWMAKWPTIADLAKAELAEVLIFWQGLGYNRRARFVWLLSREISDNRAGEWPKTEVELLKLPGIGKYTARAILSFAFGQHVAVVDTNVKRVVRRIFDGQEAAALPTLSELQWFAWADQILPTKDADPWNQLIMDFGALICTAKAPKCEVCPVRQLCQAQQKAAAAGFATYREFLKTSPVPHKKIKKTLRFEDTDRFFRGRIVDQLRESSLQLEKLWQTLHQQHGLADRQRFDQLVKNLQNEGMLSIDQKTNVISLG